MAADTVPTEATVSGRESREDNDERDGAQKRGEELMSQLGLWWMDIG